MLTDQEIQELIQLPKIIIGKRPVINFREENGHRRCDLDLQSSEGIRLAFPVFIRQNIRFSDNFSIGLRYVVNEGKLTTVTLARYNGPHGETSRTPDGHYAQSHIHYLTKDELAGGHATPQERHRVLTDEYTTFEEAIRVFFRNTSTSNYGDFFPAALQGRLFDGD